MTLFISCSYIYHAQSSTKGQRKFTAHVEYQFQASIRGVMLKYILT